MNSTIDVHRIIEISKKANSYEGQVYWSPNKSIWFSLHGFIALVGGVLTFSMDALLVFLSFTAVTLCLGHSLGMHRKLIHNAYECPKWMEYLFVHLGVLVGMAGPFGMIYSHDLRDWAQRQPDCHPYLRHGSAFWQDAWWQLHCDLKLLHPPSFVLESQIRDDKVYQWMERHWILQQIPWAILLFALGGLPWVVWGVSVRIFVSVTGHWLIGYFAHNNGDRDWHVSHAAVQGHNVRFAGMITMGESWHNNHHAYPGSALLGIYKGQTDPGWWVLNRLINLGLVWNVKLPEDLPARAELTSLNTKGLNPQYVKSPEHCPALDYLARK